MKYLTNLFYLYPVTKLVKEDNIPEIKREPNSNLKHTLKANYLSYSSKTNK